MRRSLVLACLIVIFAFGSAFPVAAWDDVGHKITAYIAWQRMSPAARENVIRILRSAPEDSHLSAYYATYGAQRDETRQLDFFMLTATWADIVRDRAFPTRNSKYHKSNWHYDDTFWRQVDGRVEVLSGFEEGGVGVEKLVEFEKLIRDPSASDADKAIAIAWIMHIGGDLHQPLHTSARVTDSEPKGDAGGNAVQLTPKGTPRADQVNLHWFWDSIVVRNVPIIDEACDRSYLEPIARSIIAKHPYAEKQSVLAIGNFQEWQKQSFALNPTDVFSPDLIRFEMPSAKYTRNAYRVAEGQLALAGYRLGDTLERVFGAGTVKKDAQ